MTKDALNIILVIFFMLLIFSCQKEVEPLETINGEATFYGEFFHGKKTKSGEVYDMNSLTAAHATYPMGTRIKVTNLENNKTVIVKINDTPRTNRKAYIDLSKAAFKQISHVDTGIVNVKIEVLAWGK